MLKSLFPLVLYILEHSEEFLFFFSLKVLNCDDELLVLKVE